MKKQIKVLSAILSAFLLFTILGLSAFAAGFDFDSVIPEFVESPLNTNELRIGETHVPSAAIWTTGGMATCYSSNENVVTIEADGTVTAVGEGSAYVAIESMGMYEVYKYTVITQAVSETESFETTEPVPAPNNNTILDDYQQKAESLNDVYESNKKVVEDTAELQTNLLNTGFVVAISIIISIFIPILGFAVFIGISMLKLSNSSMKAKILPPKKQTANTVKTVSVNNIYVLPIDKKITAQKCEELINRWLAENPYAYNCTLKLDTKASLFSPFVNYKFFVKKAVIEYSIANTVQEHQYGMAFIYKFRLFGPIGYNTDKHISQWSENNHDCKILSHHGGRIQHFGTHSGFWAQYYNYLFFKK